MPKGKLNLTMLENKYHKYEDRPQDYIIDLIK